MTSAKKAVILLAGALCVYRLSVTGAFEKAADAALFRAGRAREKMTVMITPVPTREPAPLSTPEPLPVMNDPAVDVTARPVFEYIREATVTGGMTIKNETAYTVDIPSVLESGSAVTLPAEGPQILIVHTHSSEAYTPAGLDRYEESDNCRTEDTAYNIVRVGDELTEIFENAGLSVIHDRSIYDYPSYTGSYNRSGAAVEGYLTQYPGISVVIDVHRDALGTGEVVYKTMAEEKGVCASQVMMLVGTDESGLDHPRWRDNLSLVLFLQNAVNTEHPTLMRPVTLVPQRYNQHLSPGMFILEVGCSGNTLQEALAAVRLYGDCAARALLTLVQ